MSREQKAMSREQKAMSREHLLTVDC